MVIRTSTHTSFFLLFLFSSSLLGYSSYHPLAGTPQPSMFEQALSAGFKAVSEGAARERERLAQQYYQQKYQSKLSSPRSEVRSEPKSEQARLTTQPKATTPAPLTEKGVQNHLQEKAVTLEKAAQQAKAVAVTAQQNAQANPQNAQAQTDAHNANVAATNAQNAATAAAQAAAQASQTAHSTTATTTSNTAQAAQSATSNNVTNNNAHTHNASKAPQTTEQKASATIKPAIVEKAKECFSTPQQGNNNSTTIKQVAAVKEALEQKVSQKKIDPQQDQQFQQAEASPGGGSSMPTAPSKKKSDTNNESDSKDNVHNVAAINSSTSTIMPAVIETGKEVIKNGGPATAPVVIAGTVGVGIYVCIKNGFGAFTETIKEIWHGSSKKESAWAKEQQKFIDEQQKFIKDTGAQYITRVDKTKDGKIIETTCLVPPADSHCQQAMVINSTEVPASKYNNNPPIGEIISVSSQRPFIEGFDTPTTSVAKAPCQGETAKPATPGCGPTTAPASEKEKPGCGKQPEKQPTKHVNVQTPPASPTHNGGCGEKPEPTKKGTFVTREMTPQEKEKPKNTTTEKTPSKNNNAAAKPLASDYSKVNLPNPVHRTVKETGEKCRIVRPKNDATATLEWAPQKYEEIRKWSDDVERIASNTGWNQSKIKQIKDHLFHDEHILIKQKAVGRFDPDPEIAAAWDRMYKGDFIANDIKLLEHEYFESNFEKTNRTDYDTAHAATINSGKEWDKPNLME